MKTYTLVIILIATALLACKEKTNKESLIHTDQYIQIDDFGQIAIKYYENGTLKNISSLNSEHKMHGYQTYLMDSGIEQTFYYNGVLRFMRKMYENEVHYYSLDEESSDTLFIGRRIYGNNKRIIKDNLILNPVPFTWELGNDVKFHFKKNSNAEYVYIGPVNNHLDVNRNKFVSLNEENTLSVSSSLSGLELISGIYHSESPIRKEILFYSPFYCEDSHKKLSKEFIEDITYLLYQNW